MTEKLQEPFFHSDTPHLLVLSPGEEYADKFIEEIKQHVDERRVIYSPIAAEETMRSRYLLMKEAGVSKYQELANNKGGILLIVRTDKREVLPEGEYATEEAIDTIARLGRAANVFLLVVCDTQRQMNDPIVGGELRANIAELLLLGPAKAETVEYFFPGSHAAIRDIVVDESVWAGSYDLEAAMIVPA